MFRFNLQMYAKYSNHPQLKREKQPVSVQTAMQIANRNPESFIRFYGINRYHLKNRCLVSVMAQTVERTFAAFDNGVGDARQAGAILERAGAGGGDGIGRSVVTDRRWDGQRSAQRNDNLEPEENALTVG